MPELPEVETIAANLRRGTANQPPVVGLKIISAQLFWPRSLVEPDPHEFPLRIRGQDIEAVKRRGKFLVFQLTQDELLIHLRMSGDLWVEPDTAQISQHHRLILNLEKGLRLSFNDPRKFGRVWLTGDADHVLGDLGPEPLDDSFTARDFYQKLIAHHRQLKPLLLDQSFLAGLGNIYTDEALNLARLHPLCISASLTYQQAEQLWRSIRQILLEGISRNGASIDWVYRGGEFQNYFRVYQRTGEPCPTCGTPIQRMIIGQRGTHYCPSCQVLRTE
jgi:formamidopyrimidine-DNA glycosylase